MHAPFKTMKVKFISCVFVWKLLEHLSKFSFNIAKDYLEGYYSAVFQISFETNCKVQGDKIYIRSRVIALRFSSDQGGFRYEEKKIVNGKRARLLSRFSCLP